LSPPPVPESLRLPPYNTNLCAPLGKFDCSVRTFECLTQRRPPGWHKMVDKREGRGLTHLFSPPHLLGCAKTITKIPFLNSPHLLWPFTSYKGLVGRLEGAWSCPHIWGGRGAGFCRESAFCEVVLHSTFPPQILWIWINFFQPAKHAWISPLTPWGFPWISDFVPPTFLLVTNSPFISLGLPGGLAYPLYPLLTFLAIGSPKPVQAVVPVY